MAGGAGGASASARGASGFEALIDYLKTSSIEAKAAIGIITAHVASMQKAGGPGSGAGGGKAVGFAGGAGGGDAASDGKGDFKYQPVYMQDEDALGEALRQLGTEPRKLVEALLKREDGVRQKCSALENAASSVRTSYRKRLLCLCFWLRRSRSSARYISPMYD
jgi:hypothetical protein